jgi:long-subunit fatty acid transport protein
MCVSGKSRNRRSIPEAKYMVGEGIHDKQMKLLPDRRTFALTFLLCASFARGVCAVPTLIPIAPEPVGSGARALGQSAFIAVADDATAASWNPAGLINLEKAEASFVGAWKTNTIDLTSATPDTSYDENGWSLGEINFMSYAQPLAVGNTDVVISVNYHQVYDLGLEFDWISEDEDEIEIVKGESEGAVAAYSLAGGLSMPDHPEITIGASFNWYTHSLLNGYVRQVEQTTLWPDDDYWYTTIETLDDLRGHNFTFGLLWDAYERQENLLTLGLVYHTAFTAKVDQGLSEADRYNPTPVPSPVDHLDIDFPRSLGAGVNYRFTDWFSVAFDVQWTDWSEFTHTDANPGSTPSDDTLAYRLGGEYLFPQRDPESVLACRGGAFYEPRPAWHKIVPVYGLSAGLGWTLRERFSLDFAYQYRWGEEDLEYFDYKIKEQFFVVSLITYF